MTWPQFPHLWNETVPPLGVHLAGSPLPAGCVAPCLSASVSDADSSLHPCFHFGGQWTRVHVGSSGWRPGWLDAPRAGGGSLSSPDSRRCGGGCGLALGPWGLPVTGKRFRARVGILSSALSFLFLSSPSGQGSSWALRDFPRQMPRASQQGWHESLSRDRPQRHGMLLFQPRVGVVSFFVVLDQLCGS